MMGRNGKRTQEERLSEKYKKPVHEPYLCQTTLLQASLAEGQGGLKTGYNETYAGHTDIR